LTLIHLRPLILLLPLFPLHPFDPNNNYSLWG
jgi:hypothetical protein